MWIALLLALAPLEGRAGAVWSSPQSTAISKVCFGRDRFVAVGAYGVILWSTNGSVWYAADAPGGGTYASMTSVCFANGFFVAVGTNGVILRSADGKSWSPALSPTTQTLSDVCGGAGRFVAVGESATILISTDGFSWTAVGYSDGGTGWPYTLGSLCAVHYGNGAWVALEASQTGGVRSTDGIRWTRIYSGTGYRKALIFDGTRFVAVSDGGSQSYVSTSIDGLTWQNRNAPRPLYGIAFGKGVYIVVGEGGAILSSPDLVAWTPVASVPGIKAMAFGRGMFASLGGGRVYSEDGAAWTVNSIGGANVDLTATCYFKGRQIIAGKRGSLSYYDFSLSAILPLVSGTNADFSDLACSADAIVAVGQGGVVLRSVDGISWAPVDAKITGNLSKVLFCKGKFVVIGAAGAISVSADGKTWGRGMSGVTENLLGIACDGTRVIISAVSSVLSSTDLVLWSKTAGPSVDTLGDLSFGNGVFVGVSNYGTMWSSSDGVQWTSHASGYVGSLSRVCFAAGRFVLVTLGGNLRFSLDGLSWSGEPTGLENWAGLNAIAYGNGRFFAVGNYKAILFSQKLPSLPRLQFNARLADAQTLALSMAPAESEGALFTIERSADLITWTVVAIDQSAQSDGQLWKDALGGTAARAFYRARAAVVEP